MSDANTTLDWNYDTSSNEQVATYKGFRVRAVPEVYPHDPFADDDGAFPMLVYSDRRIAEIGVDAFESTTPRRIINNLNSTLLVHAQTLIAAAMSTTVADLVKWYVDWEDLGIPENATYIHNVDVLREIFDQAASDLSDSERIPATAKLLKIAGVPCYTATSRGYSQGDWAELLVCAPQSIMDAFGLKFEKYRAQAKALPEARTVSGNLTEAGLKDWIDAKAAELMLEPQTDVWSAWAWGDVYGYIVERRDPAFEGDDDEEAAWVEVDSCWGFYDRDHDKSGLSAAAIEAINCLSDDQMSPEQLEAQQEGA
jgi:hypothetical protein